MLECATIYPVVRNILGFSLSPMFVICLSNASNCQPFYSTSMQLEVFWGTLKYFQVLLPLLSYYAVVRHYISDGAQILGFSLSPLQCQSYLIQCQQLLAFISHCQQLIAILFYVWQFEVFSGTLYFQVLLGILGYFQVLLPLLSNSCPILPSLPASTSSDLLTPPQLTSSSQNLHLTNRTSSFFFANICLFPPNVCKCDHTVCKRRMMEDPNYRRQFVQFASGGVQMWRLLHHQGAIWSTSLNSTNIGGNQPSAR